MWSTAAPALVILLVVLTAGLLGITSLAPRGDGSSRPDAAQRVAVGAAIPDRVFAPSPWLSGSDQLGPPGKVAVLGFARRQSSWFDATTTPFAISASDGSYRFLDLPAANHLSGSPAMALSPDGTKIGFMAGGNLGQKAQTDVVGLGLYDTATGDIQIKRIPTRHGLQISSMAFTGDSTQLVASIAQADDAPSPVDQATSKPYAWDLTSDRFRDLSIVSNQFGYPQISTLPTGVAWYVDPLLFRYDSQSEKVTHRRGAPGTDTDAEGPTPELVAVSPNGATMVAVATPMDDEDQLFRLEAPPAGDTTSQPHFRRLAPGWLATRILGWVDDTHVLAVLNRPSPQTSFGPDRYKVVDVTTGHITGSYRVGQVLAPQLATDLLTRPLTGAVRPTHLPDPRIGLFWIVGSVAGAAALAWWLRRRFTRRQRSRLHDAMNAVPPLL